MKHERDKKKSYMLSYLYSSFIHSPYTISILQAKCYQIYNINICVLSMFVHSTYKKNQKPNATLNQNYKFCLLKWEMIIHKDWIKI